MSLWPRLRKRSSGRGGRGIGGGGSGNEKSSSTTTTTATTTKANPYDTRGDTDDKYVTLHADFLAQRAQFAAEKGVPISVVRFVSRSARGWVFLPPPPDSPDSVLPSPSSHPRSHRHHRQKQQQQQQESHRTHEDEEEMTSSSSSSSETSREFALPPAAVPLSRSRSRNSRSSSDAADSDTVVINSTEEHSSGHSVPDGPSDAKSSTSSPSTSISTSTTASASASSSSGGNAVVDSSAEPKGLGFGSTTNAARSSSSNKLVVSRNLKDKAWMQIRKTAAVLLVKVLVFSKAVGASTGFACIIAVVVGTWNRGRGTFQRVVSSLATLLVSSLKPYLSLLEQSKASLPPLLRPSVAASFSSSSSSTYSAAASASASPVFPSPRLKSSSSTSSASAPRQSHSIQMKVSPIMEGSEGTPLVQDSSRSSSFAFPVLAPESVPELETSARFPPQNHPHLQKEKQQQQDRRRAAEEDSVELHPETEATSPVASPLAERNKLGGPAAHRRTCRLKSKLFKSSPSKTKGLENSLPSSSAEADGWPGSPTSSSGSSTGSNGSAAGGEKRKKKKHTFIRRKSSRGGSAEFDEVQQEQEQQQQPSTLKPPKKLTRSHELPFFRSANANRRKESKDGSDGSGVKNLSRSQELKCALKSLGRRKMSKSQELAPTSPRSIQGLSLSSSTVESLSALAFPFKEEEERLKRQQQQEASSPRRQAFRQRKLAKTSSSESGDETSSINTGTSTSTSGQAGGASPPSPKATSAPPSTWASPSTTFSKLFPSSGAQPTSPKAKSTVNSTWVSPSTTFSKFFPASSNSSSSSSSALQQQPSSPKSTSGTFSMPLSKLLPAHPTAGAAGTAVAVASTTDKQLRKLKTSCGFVHSTAESHPQPQVPELRKVKTSVARAPPLPTQSGELGRSELLSREILGSLLLFAILGFLLLGRIYAILGTASLCLLLSHLQRFFAKGYTSKKDRLLRKRSSDPNSKRPPHGNSTTSSPNWQSSSGANPLSRYGGSGGASLEKTAAGRQSSEYRKRVLIEGLLDRGNRRGVLS